MEEKGHTNRRNYWLISDKCNRNDDITLSAFTAGYPFVFNVNKDDFSVFKDVDKEDIIIAGANNYIHFIGRVEEKPKYIKNSFEKTDEDKEDIEKLGENNIDASSDEKILILLKNSPRVIYIKSKWDEIYLSSDGRDHKDLFTPRFKKLEDENKELPSLEVKFAQEQEQKSSSVQETDIDNIKELVLKQHNIILNGAPGTGKTHLAREIIAKEIVGEGKEKTNIEFVQFHPSYDYTDFVEGLRPTKPDEKGNIGFELKDGIFKKFCTRASAEEKKDEKFVFIIDEINRGEISKIFGELFFAIDPGYRGEKGKVKTQYANMQADAWFYVPENVYIIGTMNDIDRSVDNLDFAMRRRFVFKEISAEESAKNMGISGETEKRMTALNDKISEIPGLGSSYNIGGAYFLEDYKELWEYRLRPLLKEYLRGIPEAKKHLGDLHKAFDSTYNGDPEE